MPEKPKDERDDSRCHRETPEKAEKADESSWGKDIEEKDYYYDDAHGYEVFNPDDEDDENDK